MKTPLQLLNPDERRCWKCLKIKHLTQFYANKTKSLGRDYICKDCERTYRKTSIARKEWNKKNKDKLREGWKKWYRSNKEQWKVNYAVSIALKKGLLTKQPCIKCGEKRVHAHHEDYSKPLDVIWLCIEHHGMRHRLGHL